MTLIPPALLAAHATARAAHLATTVPSEVPAWRLHAVAARTPYGEDLTLAEAIDGLISSLPEPSRTYVHASWHRGTVIVRNSPTVLGLAAELALDASELDSLFRQAAAIAV
jgi:hypothetical protein